MVFDGRGHHTWQKPEYSLNFKANDDKLKFDNRNLDANENYSGGLLALGECPNAMSAPIRQLADGALILILFLSILQAFFQFLGSLLGGRGIF